MIKQEVYKIKRKYSFIIKYLDNLYLLYKFKHREGFNKKLKKGKIRNRDNRMQIFNIIIRNKIIIKI